MPNKKEKVVIVGAGIAGLSAAKTLAESGIKPLVLERNNEFGQKACGEMIFEERFGFSIYNFLEEGSIILRKFNKITISYLGMVWKKNLSQGLFSINRKGFEEYLAQKAEKAGAKIFLGKKVKKIERKNNSILINNEIEAKLVIGADGFHSKVREFTGQKINKYSFAITAEAETDYENPSIFYLGLLPKDYFWIFPKGEGIESNIGVISSEGNKKVWSFWQNFIKKFKLRPKKVRGAFLPAQLPLKTYFDNILLAGESACLTDSFTGAGINSALVSGYLAAKTAKEAIEENKTCASFLKKYEKEWKKIMHARLLKSYFKKIFLISSYLIMGKLSFNLCWY